MILLYTGATGNNAPQINADLSLGGYISSTPIPNGRLANLFPSLAKSDVVGKKTVIRMIALKNTTGNPVTNLKIFSTVTQGHVKLKIAAVAPATDDNGDPVFEAVVDGSALPYQASLAEQLSTNPITVPSLDNNAIIGIWIQREIDTAAFPELFTNASGIELAALLENAVTDTEETIQLNLQWD